MRLQVGVLFLAPGSLALVGCIIRTLSFRRHHEKSKGCRANQKCLYSKEEDLSLMIIPQAPELVTGCCSWRLLIVALTDAPSINSLKSHAYPTSLPLNCFGIQGQLG